MTSSRTFRSAALALLLFLLLLLLPTLASAQEADDAGTGDASADGGAGPSTSGSASLELSAKRGESASLSIDAHDVGVVPWKGEVTAGTHVVRLQTPLLVVTQTVTLAAGELRSLSLELRPRSGSLVVDSNITGSAIAIDGAAAGASPLRAYLPFGRHRIRVLAAAYPAYEETVEITAEDGARVAAVFADLPSAPPAVPAHAAPDETSGLSSGIELGAFAQVGSTGSEQEENCSAIARSCAVNGGFGGAFFGHLGYMWDHLGFDVELGLAGDASSRTTRRASNEGVASLVRAGPFVAARARTGIKNARWRAAFALGPGLGARMLADTNKLEPDKAGYYASFALTADGNVGVRLSRHTTLVLGTKLWWESAGNAVTASGGDRLVSGGQLFVIPYLGLELGP